ncbi:FG-GAP-like repeat-containing protein [Actinokineospora sp. UTMC 2448]|uniref:FG-GAP-like repeat-containing protein n=1 Tax=Actinokineospora sp. UTMC 2448 TaxID=2268449 RepID=UPI0021645626|nr:FG-GAP-like repeat-containing protein [Actinokineospora sp. UTMC 2448]
MTAGAVAAFALTGALTTPAAAQEMTPNGEFGALVYCASGFSENRSMSRSQALARSLSWIRDQVPYSMNHCHANDFGNYRADCSGFVSMVWGLRESEWTGSLHEVTHPIARADLRPGDALLRLAGGGHEYGHVAIFIGWADSARTKPRVREQAGPNGSPTTERVWTAATASTYTPVRYDKIVESSDPVRDSVDGSDISGDGAADLLGVKADGSLWYYYNNGTADGDPFEGTGSQIGSGFGVFDWVDGADISGDGSADMLARKPDGTLWYYPNNSYHNPGNVPFTGSGIQVGHGFQNFNRLDAADIDGDNRADLLGRKADGTLWYYRNGGTTNNDPFSGSGTQIGSGFGVFDWFDGADISGDGHADLIARKPDGTLLYYANNSGSNPGGVPFAGTGTQIGSGFQAFDIINAADLSGDGSADLFARKPDGTLWYYPNNRYHNPGNLPFVGSGLQIGHGFQTFTKIS